MAIDRVRYIGDSVAAVAAVDLFAAEKALSCLTLAVACRGKEITTIEGLSMGQTLHPLQTSFIENRAVQCGYCTPGMILSAKAMLDETPSPTDEEIKTAIEGNLCRCGGYPRIMKAIRSAANRKIEE